MLQITYFQSRDRRKVKGECVQITDLLTYFCALHTKDHLLKVKAIISNNTPPVTEKKKKYTKWDKDIIFHY